tara:strand:- start:5313 stop:6656 length:1344 start_codon:yes stop_codon:yes gene_type:complete
MLPREAPTPTGFAGHPSKDMNPMLEVRKASGNEKPVFGISEWQCWYANYNKPCPGPEALDECVDLHLQAGFDHLVWNLGRSVVDYWSELPNVTRVCENGDLIGGISWDFVHKVMDKVCPVRHALARCHDRGAQLWGRLGMNRHYGRVDWIGVTSSLALDNPSLREVTRPGNEDASRLCYVLEEVRRERIEILLECQQIGVDGLVLDFCRQMPLLRYHPALVEPFVAESGVDPREIDSDDVDAYETWFQYRADVLTGFMDELRKAVRKQEGELGRRCPIIARVPDNAGWLMLAYGLDTERWCAEGLVDGLMLSPFPNTREDLDLHVEYHAAVAHKHGKVCVGGVGSMGLIRNGVEENTGFFEAQPAYALAARQYAAGIDGMSLYQSETLVRMDYLAELMREVGSPSVVAERATTLPTPISPRPEIGMDWHANMEGKYGLRSSAGDDAL